MTWSSRWRSPRGMANAGSRSRFATRQQPISMNELLRGLEAEAEAEAEE